MGSSPSALKAEEMDKATEPARSPSMQMLEGLMSKLKGKPPEDTSWHDQMVQQANNSFQHQQAPAAPAPSASSSSSSSPKGGSSMADGKDKKWAADAFKESHKGRLHRALGVDEDKPILDDKMKAALAGHHGMKVQQMAQAAHNVNQGN
jgi:hypothetical protein